MSKRILSCSAAIAIGALVLVSSSGSTLARPSEPDRGVEPSDLVADRPASPDGDALAGGSGADVIVGALPNAQYFGQSGVIKGYSIATTSCNEGNVNLNWFQSGLNHPVIAQNIYRYQVLGNGVGRFEQIGMSWLKHGFCALQGNVCGFCDAVCGSCCSQLGPGCSDPYSSSLNGNWTDLGPRSEVNATTGAYLWPHALAVESFEIRGRIQIFSTDLVSGAQYFLEGQYVALDDAQAGNGGNNASWREAVLSGNNLLASGATNRKQPALRAWRVNQSNVSMQTITFNSGAGDPDELFTVAWAVTDLGTGTWNYEYAVHNLQSDRAAGSFTVPMPAGVTVTNVSGHYINHHSGEPYDTAPWTATVNPTDVTWSVVDVGSDSNALRWGTMFNFRFDADYPPQDAEATLGLFKAGTPASLSIALLGPDGPIDVPCDGDTNGDGAIDIDDVTNVVLDFGSSGDGNGDGFNGDVDDGSQTGTPDLVVNIDDIVYVVLRFGAACP